MEISSRFVGSKIRPLSIQISDRQVMNFAAGIFDDNPLYFDDSQASKLLSHPMLACAITWDISKDFPKHLIAEDFPFHLQKQQVHFSESLQWHRALRSGDRLTIDGEIAAISPHRAGTHLVVRYQATDSHGHPVFTEYSGAMLRGVRCADQGLGTENLPHPTSHRADGSLWQATISTHPLSAHLYDACAQIHFPIHTSVAFALSVGLPGTILHGTATLSYALSELLRRQADNDPVRVQSLVCCFRGMVMPGDPVVVRLLAREPNQNHTDLHFDVLDQNQKPVIADACLRIHGT